MRKNWKILLPVCTVAATATALVPCLTSCSNNSKWTDLSEWHPDESTQKTGDLTDLAAANELFGASDSIIEQDILFAHKTKIESTSEEEGTWRKILDTDLNIIAGDVEEEKCSVKGLDFDHKSTENKGLFSGTIQIKFECTMIAHTTGEDINIGTYSVEIKHEINKLPLQMSYDSTTSWSVVQGAGLEDDTDWSVERSYSAVKSYYDPSLIDEKDSSTVTYNHNHLPKATDNVEMFLFNMVFWGESYYLKKCGHQ